MLKNWIKRFFEWFDKTTEVEVTMEITSPYKPSNKVIIELRGMKDIVLESTKNDRTELYNEIVLPILEWRTSPTSKDFYTLIDGENNSVTFFKDDLLGVRVCEI